MVVRLITTLLFFIPSAWVFSWLALEDPLIKFILVYSTFYLAGGIMCIVYFYRFSGTQWRRACEIREQ